MHTQRIHLLNTQDDLAKWLKRAESHIKVAIDLEANSLHVYPEQLCLIQIGTSHRAAVIDPLLPLDLSPLKAFLGSCTLVIHDAAYDLRLFQRHLQFSPEDLFDTMIAARLCGFTSFGLADLVSQLLGVQIDKSLQKMDWAQRPLSPRMLAYAEQDTRYLLEIAEILENRLRELGRLDWHEESCRSLILKSRLPEDPDHDGCWRLRGSGSLSRYQLAMLRELWHWREKIARERRRPPYFVVAHEKLIYLASCLGAGSPGRESAFVSLPDGLPAGWRQEMISIRERVWGLTPEEWPEIRSGTPQAKDRATERRLDRLMRKRNFKAQQLNIEPTLIASRATLMRLARDWESGLPFLMKWQQQLLSEEPSSA